MIIIKWNVYYYDVNRKKINTYNIFEHSSFKKEFSVLLKCDLTKEVFSDQLKHILQYYFWGKCEWEIVLNHDNGTNINRKIDIYEQVMLNWDKFVEYCWSFTNQYKSEQEEIQKVILFAKHYQEENKYL